MFGGVLIDPRILEKFGSDYVGMSGRELRYNCPYCQDAGKTPDIHGHLYVSLDRLVYHCFRCGASGSIAEMKTRGYDFAKSPTDEELERMLDGILNGHESEKYDITGSVPITANWSGDTLYQYHAIKYMESRGFSRRMCEYYNVRIGDVTSKYKNRVIIPNEIDIDAGNGIVYTDMFVARYFKEDGGDHGRKYLNPSGANRRSSVFNLHRVRRGSPIIVTEGCLTSMSAGANAVATYGKLVTDTQIRKILSKEPEALFVALDPDARKEALELCSRFRRLTAVPIYLVDLPMGEDANSLGHRRFMEYVKTARIYDPVVSSILSLV